MIINNVESTFSLGLTTNPVTGCSPCIFAERLLDDNDDDFAYDDVFVEPLMDMMCVVICYDERNERDKIHRATPLSKLFRMHCEKLNLDLNDCLFATSSHTFLNLDADSEPAFTWMLVDEEHIVLSFRDMPMISPL